MVKNKMKGAIPSYQPWRNRYEHRGMRMQSGADYFRGVICSGRQSPS